MKIIREARGMCAPIRAINMMGEGVVWVAVGKVSQNQEKRHARSYTSQKWGPPDSCSNLFLSLPPSLFLISSEIYLFDIFLIRWRFLGETKINYDRFWFLPGVINALIIYIFFKIIIVWLMFCLLFYWRVH